MRRRQSGIRTAEHSEKPKDDESDRVPLAGLPSSASKMVRTTDRMDNTDGASISHRDLTDRTLTKDGESQPAPNPRDDSKLPRFAKDGELRAKWFPSSSTGKITTYDDGLSTPNRLPHAEFAEHSEQRIP